MHSVRITMAVCGLGFLLAGCGDPTKEDLLRKADGLNTRQELEAGLGRPNDIAKLGPIETWTYNGSNGTVSFLITGDKVTLSATGTQLPPQ